MPWALAFQEGEWAELAQSLGHVAPTYPHLIFSFRVYIKNYCLLRKKIRDINHFRDKINSAVE